MKLNRLYVKILISFIAAMVLTLILTGALFRIVITDSIQRPVEKLAKANTYVLQELFRSRIDKMPPEKIGENPHLQKLTEKLGSLYTVPIWLTDLNEKLICKSFDGVIPDISALTPIFPNKEISFKHHRGKEPLYIKVPIQLSNNRLIHINILYERDYPIVNEGAFLFGLIIIGIIIALFMVPVSRLFSVHVKQMSKTAIRIAEGDLKQRVKVKRKDEIGDLGRAFNTMAERIEAMIQSTIELTANISHELRSPLARITVAMELLSSKINEESQKENNRFIESITTEIEEMDNLIGQILLLSKLDIGRNSKEMSQVNVSSIVASIFERYEGIITKKNINYKTQLGEDIIITANNDEMRTAIINIIDNAVKYTPDFGVIEIIGSVADKSILKITNSCENKDKAELKKYFDPFYRGTGEETEGTGLGLSITKKIIENNGWSITGDIKNSNFIISIVFT